MSTVQNTVKNEYSTKYVQLKISAKKYEYSKKGIQLKMSAVQNRYS